MDKKKLNTTLNSSCGRPSKNIPASTTQKERAPVKQPSSTSSTSQTGDDASTIENYTIFWLDDNININSQDYHETIAQLQSIANVIHVFDRIDECAKFLSQTKRQKVLMLTSGTLSQKILPRIHNMPQLVGVFVFCENQSKYEPLKKSWPKIRGIFTDLTTLCQSLRQEARQCEEDAIGISFFPSNDISNQKLDQLDQSFMYTQLIKEILLELKYDDDNVEDLVNYSRHEYSKNEKELRKIEEFRTEYIASNAIYWYTCDCFLYHLLNRALREQQVGNIIRMAPFICDLHREIEKLQLHQSSEFRKPFLVYRGQGLAPDRFEELRKTKGGLISFNNFLSTSIKKDVGLKFAKRSLEDTTNVSVLFIITVDPSVSSVPFADIQEKSYFKKEAEVLFSMPTVFRIGQITKSNDDERLWNVQLTSTSDSDPQLSALIRRMRTEIEGPSALYRLGTLMIKLGEFEKAEGAFERLRKCTSDELEKGHICYQLGQIKDHKGDYRKALEFYQEALTIYTEKLPSTHPNIATCYNNIGLVFDNKNDYPKALLFYEKALEIYRKTLPDDDPNLGTCYSSIGLVHNNMGDYSKAYSYCKKALDILTEKLPTNHPLLATSHNNIGLVYDNMKKHSEAGASYNRAIEIGKQVLPPNHPSLLAYKSNFDTVRKKITK